VNIIAAKAGMTGFDGGFGSNKNKPALDQKSRNMKIVLGSVSVMF
jgi:hypothetical protein